MSKEKRMEFRDHVMTAGPGWSWRFRNPRQSFYHFRVTWAPGVLLVSGDIDEIVIRHYSFDDPWAAAAWVNGAEFDYFMSKSNIRKEYDEDATKAHIVSYAYDLLRGGSPRLMRAIVEAYGYGDDADAPVERKDACRRLRDSTLTSDEAWNLSPDHELPRYAYPAHAGLQYDALRLWAHELWEREPVWHMAQRKWRRLRAEFRQVREFVWAPIRYVSVNAEGRDTSLNGHKVWIWRRGPHPTHLAIVPARLFGCDLSRLGFWRVQGTSWPDRPDIRHRYTFRDVRPGEAVS